jgi:hypothetical protein
LTSDGFGDPKTAYKIASGAKAAHQADILNIDGLRFASGVSKVLFVELSVQHWY